MEWIIYLLFLFVGVFLGRLGRQTTKESINSATPFNLPKINPKEAYMTRKEKEEVEREQRELNTMLENINNYDGTSNGQKDIK